MKTMTCREMGGPCDAPISGETAEELMNNGAAHVMSSEDADHKAVLVQMEEMKNNPEQAKAWNDDFAAKFEALPETEM